jgi:hypothetical protein
MWRFGLNTVILGLAGVVVALAALGATLWQGYLLRRQLAHSEHVSSAQFYTNITVQWIEFDKFCIDRPHLWAYFHAGKPAPRDDGDHADLVGMAAAIANLAEICVNSKAVLGPYSGDWERYFRLVYLRGEFFRDFWDEYSNLWSDEVGRVFLTPIPGVDPQPTAASRSGSLQTSHP